MRVSVVTLFPAMVRDALDHGVVGRAVAQGSLQVECVDPRQFATDVHRTVDDRPYGGGPGMVMKVEPLRSAIRAARGLVPAGSPRIYLGADGDRFEQRRAREAVDYPGLVLVAGRYEGVDERLIRRRVDEELSLGDYVLSGGEIAAMAVIDAVVRQIPGALGGERSASEESFVDGLLDCPQYTRPEVYEDAKVPELLLSGHHENIRRWRLQQALGRTWLRRPDLLAARKLNDDERKLLEEFQRQRGDNGK